MSKLLLPHEIEQREFKRALVHIGILITLWLTAVGVTLWWLL